MKIAIASDHAAPVLRKMIVQHLKAQGHSVIDLGPSEEGSVDYPDYAVKVAEAIQGGKAELGVLICGTGIGMSMAANKAKGIRAALCTTEFEAKMTRAHNAANVLCLGARVVGEGLALAIVDTFLSTSFEGGRHQKRVEKLSNLE